MLHAIRLVILSLVVSVSLYACGGQSSGESSGTPTSSAPTTVIPPGNTVALSGAAFYSQPALGCVGCHGADGQGGAFNAINTVSPATCPSCTDVATLAADIAATMPTGASSSQCTGSTPGTCAHDIAVFMMESWINTSAPAPVAPTPGITVEPTANISTSEDATSATFTIRLDTEPSADVNISISIDDLTEGTINPANLITLTFDDSNWNIAQSVTVTGVDDGDIDGPVSYTAVTSQVVTADTDYMGMNPADVTIINTDNEVFIPAGITVTPMSGLTTSENVTTTTFSVSLDTMPTDNVSIGISSTDVTEGTVSPATLVFTNQDFNAKTVTVTGVDDGIQDGPQNFMVVTAPAVSADPEYSNLDASDVSVTNIDNEAGNPGVLVTPTMGLITSEAGGAATFTVVLQSMPNADVAIAITSDDTTEGDVDLASLTFNSANWDNAQTVTVTGADDADIDLDQAYNISLVISSADPAYTGLAPLTVSVTNQDDEENLFASGKVAYEKQFGGGSCLTCHGSVGLGTDPGQATPGISDKPITEASGCEVCGDQNMFKSYVEESMPIIFGTPADCDATCAQNITLYIYNGFSVVPPN